MTEQVRVFADHRKYPRHVVNIPARLGLTISETTVPFEIKDTTICDAGYGGFGFSLTIETSASREDLSKMLRRRRMCRVHCKFPGSDRTSRLIGEVIWVEPRVTSRGTKIRFGVSLGESDPDHLADLKAFLQSREKQGEDS